MTSQSVEVRKRRAFPGHVEVPWKEWEAPTGGGRRQRRRRRRGGPRAVARTSGPSELGRLMGAMASLSWREMLRELSTRRDGGVRGELGIDLGARGPEVRKLFFAGGYHRSVMKAGMDPEEALQEVYRGLLIRNGGTCPWDVKKSSFGHYVHIVIRCVLSNWLRKERRRAGREFLAGGGTHEDGDARERTVDGVTEAATEGGDAFARRQLVEAAVKGGPSEVEAAVALVEGLEAGRGRRELAEELGRSLTWAAEVVRQLRLTYGPT